ncbi:MAG: RimK family alpha-L-glutamate ligase [Bacilli bacterium]|nr:RimK family alpha-L-glutamate ligase [Bacilli bacterium]
MHGIIIANQEIGHNEYKIKRFKEEFIKLGMTLDLLLNDGTLAAIENNEIKINLPECDFIIYLDKDIYLARLLEKSGYRLFNKADFIKLCDDKVLTFIACANKGIRMPKTYAGPLIYTELKEENYKFLKTIEEDLGFPMIVKKVYGSLGEGVYLVNNSEELRKLYGEIYRNPILFQEYIPSSRGKSLRIMVIDQQVIGGFVRYNHVDFRSNFGETADGRTLPNPEKYFSFAEDIAKKLEIEYAGIDLLIGDDEEPILCEINSNAFFEEFEKVTKINVAERVALLIKKKMGGTK